MPNWTYCEMRVEGNEAQVFIDGIKDNSFIRTYYPMPPELKDTTSPSDEPNLAFIEKYGADNWHDWQNQNWGIKWGDCDLEITEHNLLRFETPWSPPGLALVHISMQFPKTRFTLFYSEFDMGYEGYIEVINGRIVGQYYRELPDYPVLRWNSNPKARPKRAYELSQTTRNPIHIAHNLFRIWGTQRRFNSWLNKRKKEVNIEQTL